MDWPVFLLSFFRISHVSIKNRFSMVFLVTPESIAKTFAHRFLITGLVLALGEQVYSNIGNSLGLWLRLSCLVIAIMGIWILDASQIRRKKSLV